MKFGEGVAATMLCIVFLVVAASIGELIGKDIVCVTALNRSHSGVDSATVYRLKVCRPSVTTP